MRHLQQTQLETPRSQLVELNILVELAERRITLGKEMFYAPKGYTCDGSRAVTGQIRRQNSG